jgi:hypothetical protein
MAKFESIASDSTASESVESESAAIVDLEQAVRLDPDHRPSWQRLGQVGRYGDTAPCLIRAAELKPAAGPKSAQRMPCADGFDGVGYAFHFGSNITLRDPPCQLPCGGPSCPKKMAARPRQRLGMGCR